jgi:hypothetical protein
MTNWVNIAKPLANLFGSGQSPLPDLSGGWGRLLLLTTILLLAGLRYANAQNTGEYPYRASEHAYQVPIGRAANLKTWAIVDSTNETIEYNLKEVTWASVDSAENDGGNEDVEIFFTPGIFTVGSVWYLRYREDQIHNGSITCVAARQIKITIAENNFYLQLEDDISVCNSQSGIVRSYTDIDDETFETTVTYTLTMHKEPDFDINRWEFDGIFDTEVQSLVTNVLTGGGGSVTPSTSTGDSIHFTVEPDGTGFPDTVAIELTVTHLLPVLTDSLTSVDINNGIARSGDSDYPWVFTDDNTQDYSDRNQGVNVLAIPGTQDISPGGNDNTTSAQNPLQNSTHTYVVEMANTSNYTNPDTGWMIVEDEIDGDTMSVSGAAPHYSTTGGVNGVNDSVNVTFNDNMPEGGYILYYTEQNSNWCTTIRSYPFTLGEPLDIDLFVADAQCPYISGSINTPNTVTSTPIGDTVRIVSSGYTNNWEFDFEITSTPEFSSSDVEITAVTVSAVILSAVTLSDLSIGETTTTGTVNVTNSAGSPVTSVIINVTYDGLYDQAHTINIALSDITGSFNEQDANATNSDTHTINALPQPGELVGVD